MHYANGTTYCVNQLAIDYITQPVITDKVHEAKLGRQAHLGVNPNSGVELPYQCKTLVAKLC